MKEEPGVRPALPWFPTKSLAVAATAVLAAGVLAGCTGNGGTASGATSQDNSA